MNPEKTTRTADQLVRNSELETVVPMLSDEKFRELKYSISQYNVQYPIAIAVIDDQEVIVDGYNRHKAVTQLMAEGSSVINAAYSIPIVMLDIHQLQAAKEYSIEMNLRRRQLTDYQTISWALEVFKGIKTLKEIADYLKFKTINPVKEVSELNTKIKKLKSGNFRFSQSMLEKINGLQNGSLSDYSTTHTELEDEEKVQIAIDTIPNEQLRAKINREIFEESVNKKSVKPAKETLEKIAVKIDKEVHPEKYDDSQKKDTWLADYTKQEAKLRALEDKYPDNMAMFKIATESKLKDDIQWCKLHALDDGNEIWAVVFFKVPADEKVG